MAKTKKPAPVFEVLFDKKELYPEAIPVGALSRVLSAVRRLATGPEATEDDDDGGDETQVDDGSIRLVDVKRGSAVYQFVGPSATFDFEHIRSAGKVLQAPESFDGGDIAFRSIEQLSAMAKSLDCPLVIRKAGGEKTVLARIEPDSYARLAGRLFISGDTTIRGRVERAGGATSLRCALRVSSQKRLLFCEVASEDVVRALGQYLYKDIVATGKSQWLRSNWKIVSFTVNSVYRHQSGSILDAFQALREAGGHGWDGVQDPRTTIEEVTGK